MGTLHKGPFGQRRPRRRLLNAQGRTVLVLLSLGLLAAAIYARQHEHTASEQSINSLHDFETQFEQAFMRPHY